MDENNKKIGFHQIFVMFNALAFAVMTVAIVISLIFFIIPGISQRAQADATVIPTDDQIKLERANLEQEKQDKLVELEQKYTKNEDGFLIENTQRLEDMYEIETIYMTKIAELTVFQSDIEAEVESLKSSMTSNFMYGGFTFIIGFIISLTLIVIANQQKILNIETKKESLESIG